MFLSKIIQKYLKLFEIPTLKGNPGKVIYHICVPCAIKTRGLYTFYSIFEDQNRFLKQPFFCKILTLWTVSIQDREMTAHVRTAIYADVFKWTKIQVFWL